MSEYIESVSNIYNMQVSDMTSTISALLIVAFLVYVVIDTLKQK